MNSALTFFTKGLTKGKKWSLLASPVVTLLLSMKSALIGLFFLIILDLMTGIRKSFYRRGISPNPFRPLFWKSIKSYLLRKTWKKSYEYGFGIIVVAIFETMIMGSTPIVLMEKTFSMTELAIVLPAIIEVWSIFENLEGVSKRNILKKLVEFLPEPVKKIFLDNKPVGDSGGGGGTAIQEARDKKN